MCIETTSPRKSVYNCQRCNGVSLWGKRFGEKNVPCRHMGFKTLENFYFVRRVNLLVLMCEENWNGLCARPDVAPFPSNFLKSYIWTRVVEIIFWNLCQIHTSCEMYRRISDWSRLDRVQPYGATKRKVSTCTRTRGDIPIVTCNLYYLGKFRAYFDNAPIFHVTIVPF